MPTVLKSVITADTFFHRKPRLTGCNNRKPLSVLKPQYRELKYKLPQNRTKNNTKPQHRKPLRPLIIVFFLFPGFNDVDIYNLFLYLCSESCAFNPVLKLTGLTNLGLVTKTMILLDALYLHNLTILFFRWGVGGETQKKCPWSRSITGGPCFVLTRFLLPVVLYF